MLIDFDCEKSLYVVGTGVPAMELADWIHSETNVDITLIERFELSNLPDNSQCILGFSNREFRSMLFADSVYKKYSWISYIHPMNVISASAKFGKGIVVHPMADIGYGVVIGDFGWVTPYCLISHGAKLGNNVVLSPHTIIGGSTDIGNNVTIGMSSTICDKIAIGDDIEFVMSSVVTKDIVSSGRYYSNKKVSIS